MSAYSQVSHNVADRVSQRKSTHQVQAISLGRDQTLIDKHFHYVGISDLRSFVGGKAYSHDPNRNGGIGSQAHLELGYRSTSNIEVVLDIVALSSGAVNILDLERISRHYIVRRAIGRLIWEQLVYTAGRRPLSELLSIRHTCCKAVSILGLFTGTGTQNRIFG